jgi:hypothetical protein
MATNYTSSGSGNWSSAATWGGGGTPGAASGDTATIASGHTVIVDVDGTANPLAGVTIDAGGTLTFQTGVTGTRKIALTGNVVFAISGTLNMDASGAGLKHRIELDPTSDAGSGVVIAGGTINWEGRSKTHRTLTNGAITAGNTAFTVDDDTGWEVGDQVIVITSGASYEFVTLATDNGSNNWSISGTFANSYADNVQAWNVTRSVQIVSTDTSNMGYVQVAAGSTISAWEWVQFQYMDEVQIGFAGAVTGCVALYMESGEYGFNGAAVGSVTYDKCIAFSATNAYGWYLNCYATLTDCCSLITNANGYAVYVAGRSATISGLYAVGAGSRIAASGGPVEVVDSYFWGVYHIIASALYARFRTCVFGADPAGNAVANTNPWRTIAGLVICDDCAGTEAVDGFNTPLGRVIMLNRNGVSGAVYEYQMYGMHQSDTVNARAGTCHAIDPSSATFPYRYYITIPCDTGKTPSLTLYAKGAGTLGNIEVSLGMHRCGLTAVSPSSGSLDANHRFTVDGTYAQKTINFTGTTDCAGQIEVVIDVLDSSSGILYVDDIAVTGAL